MIVVMMKPTIIMTQVTVAAAASFSFATLFDNNTSMVVPQHPTPSPTARKATTAQPIPNQRLDAMSAVESAAPSAPSTAVRRRIRPTSTPSVPTGR